MIASSSSKQKKHSAMSSWLITRIIWITSFALVLYALPVTNVNDATLYLKKFGYLEECADEESLATSNPERVSFAIKAFQRFAGLHETGELDNATKAMMNVPRCGVKDKIILSGGHRLGAGSTWPKNEITYRISKYPNRIFGSGRLKDELARAFKVWSDVTTLSFREKQTGQVDIDIRFEFRNHGDIYSFDGVGNTLAHAFSPREGGDVHFNNEVQWTVGGSSGINFFQIAVHEIGHSLGLDHSSNNRDLMAPFYSGYVPGLQLHPEDIQGIQALYGSQHLPISNDDDFVQNMEEPDHPSDAPNLCNDARIDAITRTKNGSTYVFKGDFYWKILSNGTGYPRRISKDWDGLEGNLDAALTWYDGKTYFLKGAQYWRFTAKKLDNGFPKLISVGFEDIPHRLDAVFVWSGNGKTYFFKGDKYWKFDINSDPPVNISYPQPARNWSGFLAHGIDAAFQWKNNRTYFFKNSQYYRYNDITSEIDQVNPPYPRSTASDWFRCP